jgi:CubicO group peptidase (beta-lactamase class C family)
LTRARLISIGILATLAVMAPISTAAAATGPTDYAGVRAKLSREIPQLMKASGTVGLSIALVDGEETVWARGFGSADLAKKTPVTAETLFHIGSTSKTLAATAVMQLVEEGRVDLDAPLSRYVPGFKLKSRFPGQDKAITVRSVLDMHSGIPGDINNGLITNGHPYPGYGSLLLRTLAHDYPERPADTAWAYSNSGYALLQDLVETATGEGFAAYATEHLFAPMGMARSTFDDTAVPASALSHGYVAAPGAGGGLRTIAQPREYMNAWAAGSVVSSADEMASYLKTLLAGGVSPTGQRVLAQSTLKEMTTPQTRLPVDITYFKQGLGWWLGDEGNSWMGPAVSWDGDTANFHTFFRWLPELGLGAFVSVNTSSAASIRNLVGLRALGLMVTAKSGRTAPKPAGPAPVVKPVPAKLRQASGRYASSDNGLYTVTATTKGLKLAPPAALAATVKPVILLPRADGWYAAADQRSTDPLASAWIKPATVAGHRLLLAHSNGSALAPSPNGLVTTLGEKIPADYRIPAAWRARVGSYRATDIVPGTAPALTAPASLAIVGGVLEVNGLVVEPAGPNLAFTYGFASGGVQRGAGDAVVAKGDTLKLLGMTYRLVKPAKPAR